MPWRLNGESIWLKGTYTVFPHLVHSHVYNSFRFGCLDREGGGGVIMYINIMHILRTGWQDTFSLGIIRVYGRQMTRLWSDTAQYWPVTGGFCPGECVFFLLSLRVFLQEQRENGNIELTFSWRCKDIRGALPGQWRLLSASSGSVCSVLRVLHCVQISKQPCSSQRYTTSLGQGDSFIRVFQSLFSFRIVWLEKTYIQVHHWVQIMSYTPTLYIAGHHKLQ